MKNFIYFSLISFFTIGCNTTNPIHQTTKEDPTDSSLLPELKRVFMDGGLERDVEVVSINQGMANEDLLRIQVNLKNLTKKSMNLNYKIEWMDEDGLVINDSSATWLPVYVRGAEIVAIKSVASSPTVQNFWLKLQRAKR
ncbi:MAG: YcfL family protein [Opitutae bacterium]|jgi:uncharacterized protein YcfL|nr:YcfL family protein [Opitutae bacterium]MBT5716942.1 YcfL family protein [Opitutae bacterium]